ncbi:hypothetical protein IPL85_00575 [Candidatus Saccharibacteria bacterium]|nr:MAG: hypothetical protein IPL85_00575 [Candidatus Saccharibacteria bacterium]
MNALNGIVAGSLAFCGAAFAVGVADVYAHGGEVVINHPEADSFLAIAGVEPTELGILGKFIVIGPDAFARPTDNNGSKPVERRIFVSPAVGAQALSKLKSDNTNGCPEMGKEIIIHGPAATAASTTLKTALCLDVSKAQQATNGEITFSPVATNLADAPRTLADPANLEACRIVAEKLHRLAKDLLAKTGVVPPGETVPVAFKVLPVGAAATNCDLHSIRKD